MEINFSTVMLLGLFVVKLYCIIYRECNYTIQDRYARLINRKLYVNSINLANKIYTVEPYGQYLLGACLYVLNLNFTECPHVYRYIQETGVTNVQISIVKNYFHKHIYMVKKLIRNIKKRRNIRILQGFVYKYNQTKQIPYLPVIGKVYKECFEDFKMKLKIKWNKQTNNLL